MVETKHTSIPFFAPARLYNAAIAEPSLGACKLVVNKACALPLLDLDFDVIDAALVAGKLLKPVSHLIRENANLRLKKEVALKYGSVFLTEMRGPYQTIFRGASKLPVLDY